MRKNQSILKNKEYVQSLINKAIKFDNISFIEVIDNYAYFTCLEHGDFRKRLDHLKNELHNTCPKCSRKISSKIAGRTNSKKHTIDEYVDLTKFMPLEEYQKNSTNMKFLCKIHNQEFIARATRCFGCEICKKEHHYKWKKIGVI